MTAPKPAPVTEALKPCPFCGSSSVGFKHYGLPDTKVGCNGCGAQFPYFNNRAEAIAAWNTRADRDKYEAAMAEMRAAQK